MASIKQSGNNQKQKNIPQIQGTVRKQPVRHAKGVKTSKMYSVIQMLNVVFAIHHKAGLLTFLKFLKIIFRLLAYLGADEKFPLLIHQH